LVGLPEALKSNGQKLFLKWREPNTINFMDQNILGKEENVGTWR